MRTSAPAPDPAGHDSRLTDVDFSRVLVVGTSQINKVVVAKIVERSGLKPVIESPGTAAGTLNRIMPGVVILDGGADNKECNGLLAGIATLRRAGGGGQPWVILLSNRNGTADSLDLPAMIDAVVAKPITPERLQPVIERLIDSSRH